MKVEDLVSTLLEKLIRAKYRSKRLIMIQQLFINMTLMRM